MQEVFEFIIAPLTVAGVIAFFAWKKWPELFRRNDAQAWTGAAGTHFTVLVADLQDDDAGLQTKHIISSLKRQFGAHQPNTGFHVAELGQKLSTSSVGLLHERDAAAEQKGRDWLREKSAHLLIWGSVAEAQKVIRLRFLPIEGDGHSETGYSLTEILELPLNFKDDLSTVLLAYVLGQAKPAFDANEPLLPILQPLLLPLQNLVSDGRQNLGDHKWAELCNAAATVFARIGEQSGDPSYLQKAHSTYQEALKVCTPEDMPAQWAMTQNNLSSLLTSLGERTDGAAGLDYLKSSEISHRKLLRVRTQNEMPAQWAMTQNNLANVLGKLGERTQGTAGQDYLVSAKKSYRKALKVYTKNDLPVDWAMTQNNLGAVLGTLGSRAEGEVGLKYLKSSESAFREALKVRSQTNMPVQWATTQNNIGNTLCKLGERAEFTAGQDYFKSSEIAYREALRVYTQKDMPAHWSTTQNNLGIVLSNMGERAEGEAVLTFQII